MTSWLLAAALAGHIIVTAVPSRAETDAIDPPTPADLSARLRGINPLPRPDAHKPGAHKPDATKPTAVTSARDKDGHAAVNLRVEFRTGSAELTPSATRVLDALGGALTGPELAASRFRVEGHTDTVGGAALNQALSEKRAQAVAAYLERKFSIDAARLEPVGKGDSEPLVKTPPQTPESRNRRVEIVNLGA